MAKGKQEAKALPPAMDVRNIPLDLIEIGPQMIRHDPHDDDIQELAGSIARRNLLQPIGVFPLPDGRFQLLWGSRRLAAHRRLQRPEIAARICDPQATEDIVATASVENLMRRDLTLKEEIDAIHRLTADGLSPAQISDLVGKSRAWVDRRLAFESLPPNIRDYVLEGDLPLGHAEALALVEDTGLQSYLLTHCLQHRPSLAALRASIEAIAASPEIGRAIEEGAAVAQLQVTNQTPFLACHTCDTPTEIVRLVVVRVCADCAGAIAHCATRATDAEAHH